MARSILPQLLLRSDPAVPFPLQLLALWVSHQMYSLIMSWEFMQMPPSKAADMGRLPLLSLLQRNRLLLPE